jgi:hypothetical protein
MVLRAIEGVGCLLFVLIVGWLLGLATAARGDFKTKLKSAGITKESAALLRRAGRLLNSLVDLTELRGDFGETRLSDADRARVEEWLTDYEKEIKTG